MHGSTIEIILSSRKSFDQLDQLASELLTSVVNTRDIYRTVEIRLAGLEREGLVHAKGYWRSNKYFCLYSRSQKGKRMLRYVGSNPEKIRAAQAAMHRAIEYDELVNHVDRLEGLVEQCNRSLANVISTLRAVVAPKI